MTPLLTLFIPGIPRPGGSKTATVIRRKGGEIVMKNGRPLTTTREDSKYGPEWKQTVAFVARQEFTGEPARVALRVDVTFVMPRLNGHFGTGRNAGVLKERFAGAYPVGHNTGDVDKLARLVLDALQDAKVMPDDCQVVELTTRKAYVEGPGTDVLEHAGLLVRIYPIETR